MNIKQLFEDYRVKFQTGGHRHCRPGWVNTECPYCSGHTGLHLGFNESKGYFFCWRCGWHPLIKTISELTHLPQDEVNSIIRQYGRIYQGATKEPEVKPRIKSFKYPVGTGPMSKAHKRYLIDRLFNPIKLEKDWGLLGTGPVSKLEESEYKFRVIAPIKWNGNIVSFQGRDITGKAVSKYKACPKDRELVHHKDILYGDQSKWKDTGVCVEGITDVWRMGPLSFAVFGISYKPSQVRAIAKSFKRVIVMFDDEDQAQEQAEKLIAELRFRGVDASREIITGDPGGLDQSEADYIMKNIMLKFYSGTSF